MPVPAPVWLVDSLESISVSLQDYGTSGAQLSFATGRNGARDLLDYPHLIRQYLRPFNRVIIMMTVRAFPRVLFDGVITTQSLTPSNEPGQSKVSINCEDLTVMMDETERVQPFKQQPVFSIASTVLTRYLRYGIRPLPIPEKVPLPKDFKFQRGTDLKFLQELASSVGYAFYLQPGPLPATNIAYFGPKVRIPIPQPALTVNMGANTNVKSINFSNNFKAPTHFKTTYQDENFNVPFSFKNFIPPLAYLPPLAPIPAWLNNLPYYKERFLDLSQDEELKALKAQDRKAGTDNATQEIITRLFDESNKSNQEAVSASGELDVASYGHILMPRLLVGLRGVGFTYDGLYYVKSVTHNIKPSSATYTQSFQLIREGIGSITPVLPV